MIGGNEKLPLVRIQRSDIDRIPNLAADSKVQEMTAVRKEDRMLAEKFVAGPGGGDRIEGAGRGDAKQGAVECANQYRAVTIPCTPCATWDVPTF